MKIMRRKNSNTWCLRGFVPVRFQAIEARKEVWLSLRTDSEREARLKAPVIWNEQLEAWEARLRGAEGDAEARFAAAKELAARRGFSFLPAARVATLPTDELLARGEAMMRNGKPDPVEAAAILGGAREPQITVSRALELYWELARPKAHGKSEAQVRKWKAPIKQANRDFIAVIGDKPLADITRDDVRAFRDWWLDRIETEDLNARTANKNMDHFGKVLKLVNEEKRLDLVLPIGGLRLDEGEKTTRPPFSEKWIRERILRKGALDGLDPEARAILLVMLNTGARPSEIVALTAATIKLQHNVPHISIEPDGRKLKTQYARRSIPVTGISLEALREYPAGFPTYRETEALSKVVSNYMTANNLRETPEHSLYSLRHSFEDRMLRAGIDERIRRDLMGHRLTRERYGAGADLEHLQGLLQAIAI